MRCVFILFSLCISLVGVKGNVLDSIRAEQRAEGLFIIHQVEEEETLYALAKRYGGTVQGIIDHNQILDNTIDIGQIIEILVSENVTPSMALPTVTEGMHEVREGETLYSISRMYQVKVRELKKWNGLESNAISPGMQLKVNKGGQQTLEEPVPLLDTVEMNEPVAIDSIEASPLEDFSDYLVQTGETLLSIANKIGVSLDSLKYWNELDGEFLKIGQLLKFRENESNGEDAAFVETSKGNKSRLDENGFEKVYEEGIAAVIESMNTSKYLALHRNLPIGTTIEVRNLMNNQVVYVKVVGKLPNTGLNKNLLLRISQSAYQKLGILDAKARVEVSYYKK